MKKILIPILAFSLHSCTSVHPLIDDHVHTRKFMGPQGDSLPITYNYPASSCPICGAD